MSSIFSSGVAGMGSKPAKHNRGFNGTSARLMIRKIAQLVLQDYAPVGKRTALGAGLGTMLFTRPSTGWEDEPRTRRKPSMLLRVSNMRSVCHPQVCKKGLKGSTAPARSCRQSAVGPCQQGGALLQNLWTLSSGGKRGPQVVFLVFRRKC